MPFFLEKDENEKRQFWFLAFFSKKLAKKNKYIRIE